MKSNFLEQSKLVMQVLPLIEQEKIFLLKGGTAINFFYRDLPRLSVDIDLTYSFVESREETLNKANRALTKIIANLNSRLNLHTVVQKDNKQEFITKIEVQGKGSQIKIEPNFVFRGCLFPPKMLRTTPRVEEILGSFTSMGTLSFEDLYAGKLCALLNRQHPRDIFDVKLLLDNEGITENLIEAFVIYLSCDSRPINELLKPNLKNIQSAFDSDFYGMTDYHYPIEDLIKVQEHLCQNIISYLTSYQKEFLISLVELAPKWEIIKFSENIKDLPSIKFKLINLDRMGSKSRLIYLDKIKKLFNI